MDPCPHPVTLPPTKHSPTDLHDDAVRHFLSKRYRPAEDRCRQALTLDPKYADSLHLLGRRISNTRSISVAVQDWRRSPLLKWSINSPASTFRRV
jgi:hypothetical protein